MGLGAFASKTVAAVFRHGLTVWGYKWIPLGIVRDPVHDFAKGNLWLFMDIAPWHYAWSASSASFNQCEDEREVTKFTHIKNEVMNLPWSNCLPIIKNLHCTDEIRIGFGYLPAIENIFKRKGKTRQDNFKDASDILFKHLLIIADQEQRNILQEIVWKNWKVQGQAMVQRITRTPDSTLVLSSDYDADMVRANKQGQYTGRNAKELSELPKTVYSEPLEDTKVEDEDSRMKWIQKAAEKYHRLMQNEKGRAFLEKELAIIATWGNSQADFKVGSDSNDGKI